MIRETPLVEKRADWVGRGIGLAVFCLGIAGLAMVFVLASRLTPPAVPPGQKLDPMAWGLGFGVQIVRLFISGLVASWAAGRGAQLYAAANRALVSE